MWDEEREHLDIMERLAAKHDVPHTVFAPLFSVASYALELLADDPEAHKELLEILTKLRDDELNHHDTGIKYDGLKAPMFDVLKWVIQTGCKGAIYIAERI
ncbi:hypothetical protein KIN20_014887 [Parelaphostrongylus tenuis]|nr:hypothetical protein KIN20_014887 [Parelaphostrongylus tenuis]